jgi:hypothetical protein
MKLLLAAPAAFAALLLAGCGGADTPAGQPSAEERQKLDNMAAKMDAESAETFDTSADSLVPADGAGLEGNEAAGGNAAAPAPTSSSNSAAPNNAAPNGAVPR